MTVTLDVLIRNVITFASKFLIMTKSSKNVFLWDHSDFELCSPQSARLWVISDRLCQIWTDSPGRPWDITFMRTRQMDGIQADGQTTWKHKASCPRLPPARRQKNKTAEKESWEVLDFILVRLICMIYGWRVTSEPNKSSFTPATFLTFTCYRFNASVRNVGRRWSFVENKLGRLISL